MIIPQGLLDGHIAIITGGGSGIGCGTAHVLAEAGARIAVVDIAGAKAHAVAEQIGSAARAYESDVADADACQKLAGRVRRDFGGPASILFNNAGIVRRAGLSSNTARQDWDDTIAVTVNSLFYMTHAFLEQLKETKGRIVNTGSIQSTVHTPNSVVYTTSKGAVRNFTVGLAAELGPFGIRVNAVAPGLIFTPLNEEGIQKNPDMLARFMRHIPMGRPGTPEDIAGPVLFLVSDLSQYVTGVTIAADGGYLTV
ncbi:MAG: SDR family oxidoreductase [Alphaproteobacteria bacterium]|nr:SDR family oxidoreductase [Alphaproteobacteria bacterium]